MVRDRRQFLLDLLGVPVLFIYHFHKIHDRDINQEGPEILGDAHHDALAVFEALASLYDILAVPEDLRLFLADFLLTDNTPEEFAGVQEEHWPVSYTHLTLPTILLV